MARRWASTAKRRTASSLTRRTLRVPLILFAPGHLPTRVVTSPAQHVDIVPTVLDLLKVAPPANAAPFAGRSLLAAVAGEDAQPRTAYFEALSASLNRGWAPLYGVFAAAVKYIDLPLPELYDLGADAKELANLVAASPCGSTSCVRCCAREERRTAASRDRGGRRRARTPAQARLHQRERHAGKGGYTEADDPKRLIQYDGMIDEASRAIRTATSKARCGSAARSWRRKPDMALGRMHFGFLQRQTGNIAEAVAQLKAALALNPYDMDVVSLLGAYLSEAGRSKEAVAVLEPYAAAARCRCGGAGRPTASTSRASAAAPMPSPLSSACGARSLERHGARERRHRPPLGGRPRPRAAPFFRQALKADPNLARAHNSLGVIAAGAGRLRRSRAEWRRAVELEPDDFRRHCSISAPC